MYNSNYEYITIYHHQAQIDQASLDNWSLRAKRLGHQFGHQSRTIRDGEDGFGRHVLQLELWTETDSDEFVGIEADRIWSGVEWLGRRITKDVFYSKTTKVSCKLSLHPGENHPVAMRRSWHSLTVSINWRWWIPHGQSKLFSVKYQESVKNTEYWHVIVVITLVITCYKQDITNIDYLHHLQFQQVCFPPRKWAAVLRPRGNCNGASGGKNP